MRVAIMQPYFFPYIGYFQLLHAVDRFVVYDNIQFSKGGWIHRNRILVNGSDKYISLSLKKDSDYRDIRDRSLHENFPADNVRLLRKIDGSYFRAPYFEQCFPIIRACLSYQNPNLFEFLLHSLCQITQYLQIKTPFIRSSELAIDHSLKGQDKVISICKHLGASTYVNPHGGMELYKAADFARENIQLQFLVPGAVSYDQGGAPFVPSLSIIDVLMWNSATDTRSLLKAYTLQ